MTYDFFNSGKLAFGKKITSVFNSLYQLLDGATEHLGDVTSGLDYYSTYSNKNYMAPEPTRGDMPARTDELFDLLEDYTLFRNVRVEDNKLVFDVVIFDKNSSRITNAIGNTELTSGYAFVKLSTALDNFEKTIRFSNSDAINQGEILICKFTRDGNDLYINNPNTSNLNLTYGSRINYRYLSMELVSTSSYTCDNRAECVIVRVRGVNDNYGGSINVKLNDVVIFEAGSTQYSVPFVILYLKKGDKVTGDRMIGIYRVNYNK